MQVLQEMSSTWLTVMAVGFLVVLGVVVLALVAWLVINRLVPDPKPKVIIGSYEKDAEYRAMFGIEESTSDRK